MATKPRVKSPSPQAPAAPALTGEDFLGNGITPMRPEDRWLEETRRKLYPVEVESILQNALGGDLRDQQRLFQIMADTWPRLQNNLRTLRDAAATAPYTVHAASATGEEATLLEEDQANLVETALWSMAPNTIRLELGMEKTLSALAEADITGHAVIELLWKRTPEGLILPRAGRAVAAGWWAYPTAATHLADTTDRLMLRAGGQRSVELTDFPPHKFLVSIQPGHAGHPSQAATLRALAKYWVACVFGLEWLMSHAQLFNVPFRWANYPKGDTNAKSAVAAMLANIGTAGWAAFPEGVKLQFLESAKAAAELPSKLLGDLADTACDILILGQTLTSDTGDTGGGSFALGKVHSSVRRERLASICRNVATLLTEQLVPAIISLNYGTLPARLPEIRCDMPEPEDAKANAERDKVLVDMGMEIPLAWMHERHGVPIAEEGEELFGKPAAPPPPADPKAKPPAKPVKAAQASAPDFIGNLTDIYEALLTEAMTQGWNTLNPDTP